MLLNTCQLSIVMMKRCRSSQKTNRSNHIYFIESIYIYVFAVASGPPRVSGWYRLEVMERKESNQ